MTEGESIGEVTAVEGDRSAMRLVVRSRQKRADSAGRRHLHGGREGEAHLVRPPEDLLELNGEWR